MPELHWSELMPGQYVAFAFLSRVFAEPPLPSFIIGMVERDLMGDWPLPQEDESTKAGIREMQTFLSGGEGFGLDETEDDFNHLFVGPGQPLAPPWESYYRNADHLLFQQETLDIRELYRKHGLLDSRTSNEPEDSLSLEFDFVSILSMKGYNATLASRDDELASIQTELRSFLDNHLLRWAPDCLHLVEKYAVTSYYQATAALALGTLKQTAQAME